MTKNFDLCHLDSIDTASLIYHYDLQNKNQVSEKVECSFVGSYEKIENCANCGSNLSLTENLQQSKFKNQDLKLYFDESSETRFLKSKRNNYKDASKLSYRKIEDVFSDLTIVDSNFHVIISNFIECRSIDQSLSSINKYDHHRAREIEVNHCRINLLSTDFHIFEEIKFNKCDLEFYFELFSDKFHITNLKLQFNDFKIIQPIIIFDFAKIEPKTDENSFYSEMDDYFHILKIINCRVTIFGCIPPYFTKIEFLNCDIIGSNDLLSSNLEFYKNRVEENNDSSDDLKRPTLHSDNEEYNPRFYMYDCEFYDQLLISGFFRHIEIRNCKSTLFVDSDCEFIYVINHNGAVTVNSAVENATLKADFGFLKIDDGILYLKNLKIDNIYNLRFQKVLNHDSLVKKINNREFIESEIPTLDCPCQTEGICHFRTP